MALPTDTVTWAGGEASEITNWSSGFSIGGILLAQDGSRFVTQKGDFLIMGNPLLSTTWEEEILDHGWPSLLDDVDGGDPPGYYVDELLIDVLGENIYTSGLATGVEVGGALLTQAGNVFVTEDGDGLVLQTTIRLWSDGFATGTTAWG